jgi:hypothetical protein
MNKTTNPEKINISITFYPLPANMINPMENNNAAHKRAMSKFI